MFAKLLKHDFRAVRGTLGLLCLISLSSAFLGGGILRLLERDIQSDPVMVMSLLALTICIFALIICGAACQFLSLFHFYKSRFTDQGYLTFTLPVTHHQNLLSAFLICILGCVLGMALMCLSFGVLLLAAMGIPDTGETDSILAFFASCGDLIQTVGLGNTVLMAAYLIIASLSELLLIMLSITIGAVITRRHKVLAAVGVYYGVHMAMSTVVTLIGVGTALPLTASGSPSFAQIMLPQLLLCLVVGILSYFLMHYLTGKRLNLN